MLSLLQNMVGRHAQHVHNADQQVMLRGAWEQGQAQEELSSHATQGPHVYSHVVGMPQQHLRTQPVLSAAARVKAAFKTTARDDITPRSWLRAMHPMD